MNNRPDSSEELSALFDSELADDQCRTVVDRLLVDGSCARKWQNYQRIGQLLRGEADLNQRLLDELKERVAAEPLLPGGVESRPSPAAKAAGRPGWRLRHPVRISPPVRRAIAASLLLLPLVALLLLRPDDDQITTVQLAVTADRSIAQPQATSPTLADAAEQAGGGHLSTYLASHYAYSEQIGGQRLHSAVRLVGLENTAW